MRLAVYAALACVLWLWVGSAWAHGLAPIAVDVRESAGGRVTIDWTLSLQGSGLGVARDGTPLTLELPEHCVRHGDTRRSDSPAARASREVFDCGERGLSGRWLEVLGLPRSEQAVVLRYHAPTGEPVVRTLFGTDDRFRVPRGARAAGSGAATLGRLFRVGLEHIAGGWDHLAFVLCLTLVAGTLRRLLWAVTAFTLAHSLTLALGALDVWTLPSAPVEACIALSVVWMAGEAVRARPGRAAAAPLLVAYTFAFGLLHGMGFAGALSELGLSGSHFAWALLGFNLGVEAGQLCVIALLLLAAAGLGRLQGRLQVRAAASRLAAEAAGVLSGYWLVERTLSLF